MSFSLIAMSGLYMQKPLGRTKAGPPPSEAEYLAVSISQNRPRGIAQGQFSKASRGTFQISTSSPAFVKPGKRQYDRDLVSAHSPLVGGKRTSSKGLSGNPIVQEESRFTPRPIKLKATQDWRPSPLTEYTNDKRLLHPYERGVVNPEAYTKRNSSKGFQGQDQDVKACRKRSISPLKPETGELLQYRYALPYRREQVTEKPTSRSFL